MLALCVMRLENVVANTDRQATRAVGCLLL